MEEKNFEILEEVLKRLEARNLLDHIVIVGSWCIFLYKEYFKNISYQSSIRTRDVDFFIPHPVRTSSKTDIFELIEDLGFIREFKGDEGYTRFSHPDLIIEFLIEEKGKETSKPIYIKELGVTPQPLRFLNLLNSNLIKTKFGNIKVLVPHPANFALHKLLISPRRDKNDKSEKDKMQGIKLLRDLIENGELDTINLVFSELLQPWQKSIKRVLLESNEEKLFCLIRN